MRERNPYIIKFRNLIRTIVEKIKNFIMKHFKPLLQKINLIKDPDKIAEDNIRLINALKSVDINIDNKYTINPKIESVEQAFGEITIYNPFMFKRKSGEHYIRSNMKVYNYNFINRILDDILRGSPLMYADASNAIRMIESHKIEIKESIESHTLNMTNTLDKCLEIQDNVINSTTLGELEIKELLNLIYSISNRINLELRDIHKYFYDFFSIINKKVAIQFKNVDHISKFINNYMNNYSTNYNYLKKHLISIFKYLKYKPKYGASRIFILNSEDDKTGFKIAYNHKGVIDNKREYDIYINSKGKPFEKFIPQMESMDSNEYVIRCEKIYDVGNIDNKEMRIIKNEIDRIKAKENNFKLRGDFLQDIFHNGYIVNYGNIGRTNNGNIVLIDFANVKLE